MKVLSSVPPFETLLLGLWIGAVIKAQIVMSQRIKLLREEGSGELAEEILTLSRLFCWQPHGRAHLERLQQVFLKVRNRLGRM